jgi:hypothetical protein
VGLRGVEQRQAIPDPVDLVDVTLELAQRGHDLLLVLDAPQPRLAGRGDGLREPPPAELRPEHRLVRRLGILDVVLEHAGVEVDPLGRGADHDRSVRLLLLAQEVEGDQAVDHPILLERGAGGS